MKKRRLCKAQAPYTLTNDDDLINDEAMLVAPGDRPVVVLVPAVEPTPHIYKFPHRKVVR